MANASNEADDTKLWPPTIERMFIDIMVDERAKGNMVHGVFKRNIWENIRNELNKCANRVYSKLQVRTKFIRLRSRHHIFSQLLRHTGMGWDAVTGTVTASDEVWSNVIAVSYLFIQKKWKLFTSFFFSTTYMCDNYYYYCFLHVFH